jgi:hypothetical protein
VSAKDLANVRFLAPAGTRRGPTLVPPPTPSAVQELQATVRLRLQDGGRIEVGTFDLEVAKDRARTLMAELQDGSEWPYLSGRYVCPGAVVSIDVELETF